MANTFIMPDDVVQDATLKLFDGLRMANTITRRNPVEFAGNGGIVKVASMPNGGTAGDLVVDGTASAHLSR
jgi:hypothetical protein